MLVWLILAVVVLVAGIAALIQRGTLMRESPRQSQGGKAHKQRKRRGRSSRHHH